MTRVYLFALMPGDKRPRVVKWWPKVVNDEWHGGKRIPDSPRTLSDADFRSRPGSYACGAIAEGFPVWLVECESAAAGRATIQAWQDSGRAGARWPTGRILDSGGRP